MEETKKCGCGGMNEECMYCGGTGNIVIQKIEILKINSTKKELEREKEELNKYLHHSDEKLYVSNKLYKNKYLEKIQAKSRREKPKTRDSELPKLSDSFDNIGPNNPNRLKLGDTRNLGVNKNVPVKKKKR